MADGKKVRIILCAGLSIILALGLACEIIRVPMKVDNAEIGVPEVQQVTLNQFISKQLLRK